MGNITTVHKFYKPTYNWAPSCPVSKVVWKNELEDHCLGCMEILKIHGISYYEYHIRS